MTKMFSLTSEEAIAWMGWVSEAFSRPPAETTGWILTKVDFTPERLERAKRGLASIDVIGFQESFGDFCADLSHRFGWDLGPQPHENRSEPTEVSAALRARIAEDNAMDIELYEYACDLYERRRSASTAGSIPSRDTARAMSQETVGGGLRSRMARRTRGRQRTRAFEAERRLQLAAGKLTERERELLQSVDHRIRPNDDMWPLPREYRRTAEMYVWAGLAAPADPTSYSRGRWIGAAAPSSTSLRATVAYCGFCAWHTKRPRSLRAT